MGTFKPPYGSRLNLGHPLAKGLVGCWLMNEGIGDKAYDLSGNGNHGELKNGAFFFKNEIEFDGSDDGVEIPSSPSLKITKQITLVAIVKFRSFASGGSKFVCKYWGGAGATTHYQLQASATGLKFSLCIGGFLKSLDGSVLSTDEWSTIIGTYDGATMRIYQDGVETNSAVQSGLIDTDDYPLVLGNSGQAVGGVGVDATRNLDGYLKMVGVCNKAWSSLEVKSFSANPYAFIEDPYPIELFASVAAEVGWQGKINRVTNPAKINGIPVANIKKVMRI